MHVLLVAVASLIVEHRLSYSAASLKVLLGPGIKPVSSALAGGFLTNPWTTREVLCVFLQLLK